jgi:intracellular sulfur oxidation DsrE/DsrF family protein
MSADRPVGVARRSFLSRFGTGAAAFATALAATRADAQSSSSTPVSAARHAEDDWFDVPGAKHRTILDTTSSFGYGRGLFYSNNLFTGNQNGYGLKETDLAIIVSARHEATPFGYNDAMWAKYGQELSVRAGNFLDPKTKVVPTVNVYMATGYGDLGNGGVTVEALSKRGVRLAVCSLATRAAAGMIARRTGASVDDVFKELSANLVPNARLVPAGVVAVTRSQERGYALLFVG